mmetsp:Transcript_9091/g.10285  ORF Transcript_9091/g.10285 Transcript_9091/m.10285 type:complete len:83 (+) Transcript_9091:229-477(+)
MKEYYLNVNCLCPGFKGLKTPPRMPQEDKPLLTFRRNRNNLKEECDFDEDLSESSDVYDLSVSEDSESLNLGTFRSNFLSDN